MRHYVLTRSAYGSAWSPEANRARLAMSRAVTVPSLRAQSDRGFEWLVLLHPADALLDERRAVFEAAGARFLYLEPDVDGEPAQVAWQAYRAGWADAIGDRGHRVAMTRLDDDDALAPWVMARLRHAAARTHRRTALVFPNGLRIWRGRYTVVRHLSNAMQTLVTPPGDEMTVYGYKHREVRQHADVRQLDARPAWVWSRHDEALSGWRRGERALTPDIRAMFPIDWSIFGDAKHERAVAGGRYFR